MTSSNRMNRAEVRTRLTERDYLRFHQIAKAKGKTPTDLARLAVINFIENYEKEIVNDQENIYARQLRASTNRICALLAKVAIDGRTTCRFLAEVYQDQDRFNECRNAAIKQVMQSLSLTERSVAEALAAAISINQQPSPEQQKLQLRDRTKEDK